jgi:hypothetical protein
MVWYAYKDCKDGCRCAPRPGSTTETAPPATKEVPGFAVEEEDAVQCSEAKPCDDDDDNDNDADGAGGNIDLEQKKAAADRKWKADVAARAAAAKGDSDAYGGDDWSDEYGHEEPPPSDQEEEEPPLSFADAMMDWADENWRLVFGGIVVLVLSCILLPSLLAVGLGAKGPAASSPAAAASTSPAAAAASAESSDAGGSARKASDTDAKTKDQ